MSNHSDLNNNPSDSNPDISKPRSGPPGYAFQWILDNANASVLRRFLDATFLQLISAVDGKEMSEMTLEEMDEYWNAAKKL